MVEQKTQQRSSRLRAIWPVIRSSWLHGWLIVFVVLFLAVAVIVTVVESDVGNFGDAVWLMFEVVTTMGIGDFVCDTVVGRLAIVALSLYSILFLALVTASAVNICQAIMVAHRDESVAHFIYQLEHLPDLSQEELAEVSEKVKRIGKRRRKRKNAFD